MVFSVNSSGGAFAALQNLYKSGRGLKSAGASLEGEAKTSNENRAAAVLVDEKAKRDPGGLGTIKESLLQARAATDIAEAAAKKAATILADLDTKAEHARDAATDEKTRQALNDDFLKLRDEINAVVEGADYQGFNAVKPGGQPILAVATETGDRVIEIAPKDLSLGGPNIVLKPDQDISSVEAAAASQEAVRTSLQNVDNIIGAFEAGSARIDAQLSFVDKLSNTVDEGVGNLVETDLAKESANLQALSVKQQLGLQDLSIANQRPGAILSLFE